MWQPFLTPVAAYGDRATGTMEIPPKVQVVFHLPEVGQDFQIRPFIIAPGRPVVIGLWDAAVEDRSIDGAGSARRLPARDSELGLLRGDGRDKTPAMGTVGGQPHVIAELEVIGEMFEIWVIRSGLEEKHRPARVLRQASREHAASRPCANDNHVVSHIIPPPSLAPAICGLRRSPSVCRGTGI